MSNFQKLTISIKEGSSIVSNVTTLQSKATSKVFGQAIRKRRNNFNDQIRIMFDNHEDNRNNYKLEEGGITFEYSNVTPFAATLLYCFDRAKSLGRDINVEILNRVFCIDTSSKKGFEALRSLLVFFMTQNQFDKIKLGKVTENLVRTLIFKAVTFTPRELALRISTNRGIKQTLEQYLDSKKDTDKRSRSLGNNLIHGSEFTYAERFEHIENLYSQEKMMDLDPVKLVSSLLVANNADEVLALESVETAEISELS